MTEETTRAQELRAGIRPSLPRRLGSTPVAEASVKVEESNDGIEDPRGQPVDTTDTSADLGGSAAPRPDEELEEIDDDSAWAQFEAIWDEAEPIEVYIDHSTAATHDHREGWDDSDVQTLISHLGSGITHAEIAKAMGRTVNGVTGKIYRLRKQGKID